MPVYTVSSFSALTDVKEYEVHVEGLQDEHGAIANVHFGELGGAKQNISSADVLSVLPLVQALDELNSSLQNRCPLARMLCYRIYRKRNCLPLPPQLNLI